MKNQFPEYRHLKEEDYKKAWSEGLIVFDTNVLLNLYRYQKSTRDDFLRILKDDDLKDRVWIPYQVAVEFQRNRIGVIADLQKHFVEVKNLFKEASNTFQSKIDKLNLDSRHSTIDPDDLKKKLDASVDEFVKSLDEQAEAAQKITHEDLVCL